MSPDGTEKPYGKSPGIKIHLKKKKKNLKVTTTKITDYVVVHVIP